MQLRDVSISRAMAKKTS